MVVVLQVVVSVDPSSGGLMLEYLYRIYIQLLGGLKHPNHVIDGRIVAIHLLLVVHAGNSYSGFWKCLEVVSGGGLGAAGSASL